MVSSDDEGEVVPESVTNYHFVDENEAPVSFSVLPLRFDESERPETGKKQVFLHGTTDGGLQKVFKQVTAWKTRLGHEDERPEFFVFSKDKKWIKLLKPRKVYEQCIRKILITVQLLHFLKKNPEAPGKNLWDHLRKIFSSYEDRPSYYDLRDHIPVMKLFLERDEILAKCQLLPMFLEDVPMKKTFGEENDSDAKKSFIVYDDADEDMGDDGGNESEDESDCFDSVCAICDNGGELLCCEGRCLRSFHATKKAGEDSDCKSLGFTKSQVEEIQNFLCKNCQYSQHQCFICGKLGSSDKSAGAKPEVYACSNATCGHFYHLECVSQLLFPGNETEAAGLQERIREGETFVCPVHTCVVCKQTEDKKVKELQFAMCRRCPKSYHRKCLPRKIAFEDIEEEDIIQRAWDDLLPNRILIYCLKHKIDEDLGTPIRNHIMFPEIPDKKNSMDGQKSKIKVLVKKHRQVSDYLPHDRTSVKPMKVAEKLTSTEGNRSFVKSGRNIAEQVLDSQKKLKTLKEDVESEIKGADGGSILADAKRTSLDKAKSGVKMYSSSFPVIDAVIEKKIIALMGKASSSVTLEDVIKKRYMPSTHAYSARHNDKNLTHGKVEVSVEAVRTALKKLDSGGSVEDAKAVCEPDIVKQISKWNNKLKVYLAPFLHGMRYTSFGRHFTKVDKLNEIVSKLQWYVQSGDTIVDFCCGANDFSQLMKEKLEAAGKKCSYKNYDVIQPKNDFNFEKRDWMKVHPTELPTGSQLIMGLNPPFGVKAGLANQFINKALTFKPKLLILIVPQETERLDQKKPPYDLIWEDNERLSGKAFYLPGSVDVNDKQMDQWNLKPPPLYLWSRQDWTAKHKAIALKHGHMSKDHQKSPQTEVETQRDRIADAQKTSTAASEEIRRDEKHKMAENSINRKSPENHKTKSRKKKKAKRKRQEASENREVRARESSDMSISPQHSRETTNQSMSHVPSEASDSPKQRASGYGSRVEFGSVSEVGRSAPSIDEVDDIAKRYAAPSIRDGMFGSSSNNWTGGGIDNHDYGMRSSEDRFATYSVAEPYGRSPYMDGYSRSSDIDTRMPQARLYGMQGLEDLSQRNRFSLGVSEPGMGLAGRLPSSTYGHSSAMSGSSAMQRYAPRLDETNYSMPGSVGLGASSFPGGRTGSFDMPGVRRDMPPPDSLSFTPGSHHPFSGQGSGGWIDD